METGWEIPHFSNIKSKEGNVGVKRKNLDSEFRTSKVGRIHSRDASKPGSSKLKPTETHKRFLKKKPSGPDQMKTIGSWDFMTVAAVESTKQGGKASEICVKEVPNATASQAAEDIPYTKPGGAGNQSSPKKAQNSAVPSTTEVASHAEDNPNSELAGVGDKGSLKST
jgi:hypothetical protein